MKLIESKAKYIPQENGLGGIYKQIELAGRTCYKSEDKITENSAKDFVDRMIASKHLAMCEHGTLYFKIPANIDVAGNFLDEVPTWTKCKLVESQEGNWWAITTNLRVMIEHFAPEYTEELIEKYLCEPTECHEKRYTFKFTTDQGVLREITRHRVFSFAVESTRYCNYSKDKFGEEITFIEPNWEMGFLDKVIFISHLSDAENHYMALIDSGWKPQQARNVLPLATKCDIIMTGFASDWKHFFDLRLFGTTGKPHPDMELLASKASQEAIKVNIINDIVSNSDNIKI